MNPANLKMYAMRKHNIKMKQEDAYTDAYNENYVINKITDILEANGVNEETINNYINDIFSYDSYEPYAEMSEQDILQDFYDWK